MSNMAEPTVRPKFNKREIRLVGRVQVDTAIAMLQNCPVDADRPLLLTLGEEPKGRGLDANARMWAGPLRDIAEQAWVTVEESTGKSISRQFTAEVWHEYFKKEFLFEDDDLDLAEMVKDGYRKWDYAPDGSRVLVGSTTQLTKRGFANYLEQVCAYGAGLGVMFHEAPNRA